MLASVHMKVERCVCVLEHVTVERYVRVSGTKKQHLIVCKVYRTPVEQPIRGKGVVAAPQKPGLLL